MRVPSRLLAVALLVTILASLADARPQRLEAVTAVDDTSRVDFGPSGFTRSLLDSLSKAEVRVDSLGAFPPKIWILEGGSFELRNLDVRAADAEGKTVYGVPVIIELESLTATFGLNRIMGYQPGRARLAIKSLLLRQDEKSTAQTFVDIEVYSR